MLPALSRVIFLKKKKSLSFLTNLNKIDVSLNWGFWVSILKITFIKHDFWKFPFEQWCNLFFDFLAIFEV